MGLLRDRMLAGKMASGEFVREPEISNALGVSRTPVREALGRLASEGFLERVARRGADHRYRGTPGYIVKLPKPTRLALEMALHEEDERRALEGELWRLEQAWREAEEIAGISDDLLLPEGASSFLDRHSESDDGSSESA